MSLLSLLKSTARVTCLRLSDLSYKTIVCCVTVFPCPFALSFQPIISLDVSCCHHLLHIKSNYILDTTCLFLPESIINLFPSYLIFALNPSLFPYFFQILLSLIYYFFLSSLEMDCLADEDKLCYS